MGKRYGFPVTLEVKALDMHNEGAKFYQADNGVWLTDSVPSKYLVEPVPELSEDQRKFFYEGIDILGEPGRK
ncbi:RNA 2'-phosphotransferase [compost metagenome]